MKKISQGTILKHLTNKYFVIDVGSYKVVDSNDSDIKPGQFCYKILHQIDKPCAEYGISCICDEVEKRKQQKSYKHYHLVDGELVSTDVKYVPIFDDNEELTHIIVERSATGKTHYAHSSKASSSLLEVNTKLKSIFSEDGEILYMNKNAAKNLNIKSEDIFGKNICSFVTDEQAKKLKLMFSEVLRTKEAIHQELPVHFIDRSKLFLNKMEAVRFGSSLKWAILSTSQDISDKIISDNIQKQYDVIFKMIAENIDDVIWKFDLQTFSFSYISPSVFQLRGLTSDEAMKETLEDSLHPDDFLTVSKMISRTIEEHSKGATIKMNDRFEVRQYRSDKSLIWIEISVSFILDENNKPIELLGVSRDITSKRASKDKLEKSLEREQFFGDIIRNSSQAIIIAYPGGRVFSSNKSAYSLFGYTDEEMKSVNWISDLTPQKWQNIEKEFLNTAVNGKKAVTYEKEIIRKDGYQIAVELLVHPKFDEQGEIQHFVTFISDLTEITKVQKTLEESEEKYKILFENTNVGVGITTIDGRLLNANHQLLDYMGHAYENYEGVDIRSFYAHKADRDIFIEQITEKGEVSNYHFQFRRLNGSVIWVSLSSKIVIVKGEKRFITIMTNIDRQIKSDQRLKESEERFKNFSKLTNEGILIHDKGITVDINESLLKILGYKRNELMGKNIIDMCSTEKSLPIFYKNVNIKATDAYEAEIINKTGKVIPVEVKGKASIFNGRAVRVTTILDITERKKDRQEITDMSTRLSLAIKAANFGVWELNLKSQELFWDEKLHEIYDLDIHDKQDKYTYFKKALVQKDRRRLFQSIANGIKNETLIDEEFSIFVGGKLKHLKAYVQVAPAANNDYSRLIGITYDISIQKQFEKEIISERKKALESDQLKSAFLANMSHEIRTPLNGIIGFTELLQEMENDFTIEEKNQYLGIISNNGQILLHLVNDIIDLSKIETGQLQISLQKIKLHDVIKKIAKTFEPQATQKDLTLLFDFSVSDILLNTDFTRLTQIFNNLIGNALKFTTKGYIKINYQENGKFILFSVEDTGTGISEEAQKIVFDRFAQGQPIRDQLLGGTGLGLSITKGLVKLLGGEIWLESEEEKGSTFYFTILKG